MQTNCFTTISHHQYEQTKLMQKYAVVVCCVLGSTEKQSNLQLQYSAKCVKIATLCTVKKSHLTHTDCNGMQQFKVF